MNEYILNSGFKLYALTHKYDLKGTLIVREYLALAYSEEEGTKEVPFKFIHTESTNEYKVTTFSNDPKTYEEFFSLGVITTKDELENVLDGLPFLIKEINLEELNKYA